ncbi:MAG: hypothetical protein DRJ42_23040 [Deltaproteobacteria bacterium]|nr:MAG: hypothetical protein DRJ42_23040 [Deltaproteobacteria bacterium]
MAAELKLKGINFNGTLGAFAEHYGDEARASLLASLEGEIGEALRGGMIIASGWYPASWYGALLAAIVDQVGGGDDTARTLAREAVKADFQTLFKVVRLFLSPEKAAQQAMRVSKRYVDGGVIEVVSQEHGEVQYRFREYHGYTRLMWRDFIGGIEGVLENMGAEDLRNRIITGGNDGNDHLDVAFRWNA